MLPCPTASLSGPAGKDPAAQAASLSESNTEFNLKFKFTESSWPSGHRDGYGPGFKFASILTGSAGPGPAL